MVDATNISEKENRELHSIVWFHIPADYLFKRFYRAQNKSNWGIIKKSFLSNQRKKSHEKFSIFFSVSIVIHLSLGVILADPSSSYKNDKSKPVNVDYKNGSIAAYNGKFLVAIKHLERAARISPNNPDVYNFGIQSPKTGPTLTVIQQLQEGTETEFAPSGSE